MVNENQPRPRWVLLFMHLSCAAFHPHHDPDDEGNCLLALSWGLMCQAGLQPRSLGACHPPAPPYRLQGDEEPEC